MAGIQWDSDWARAPWVFTTKTGRWLAPNHVHETFKRLLHRAHLPPAIRIHDLRHAMATQWLAQGIPVKVVSERLGHANVAITLEVYSHVLPDMQAQAAQQMDRVLLGP